jgi:hypothetical protein
VIFTEAMLTAITSVDVHLQERDSSGILFEELANKVDSPQ